MTCMSTNWSQCPHKTTKLGLFLECLNLQLTKFEEIYKIKVYSLQLQRERETAATVQYHIYPILDLHHRWATLYNSVSCLLFGALNVDIASPIGCMARLGLRYGQQSIVLLNDLFLDLSYKNLNFIVFILHELHH